MRDLRDIVRRRPKLAVVPPAGPVKVGKPRDLGMSADFRRLTVGLATMTKQTVAASLPIVQNQVDGFIHAQMWASLKRAEIRALRASPMTEAEVDEVLGK